MSATGREVIHGIGRAAIGASLAAALGDPARAQPNAAFRIEDQFATFMRDLGGSAEDAGGRVLFTGRDPILQSPFRLGACMAIPAMAGGVEAAAVSRERTGHAHGLSIDPRQAAYRTAPWVRVI